MSELRFETTLAASDIREVIDRGVWRFCIVLGIVVFAVMTLLRLQRPSVDSWDLISDLLIYAVVMAISVFVWRFVFLFIYSNRIARGRRVNGPTTYVISDSGIALEEARGSSNLKWQAFRVFKETKGLILLRLQERGKVLIIPKRDVPVDEQESLLNIIASHVTRIGS